MSSGWWEKEGEKYGDDNFLILVVCLYRDSHLIFAVAMLMLFISSVFSFFNATSNFLLNLLAPERLIFTDQTVSVKKKEKEEVVLLEASIKKGAKSTLI